VVGGNREVPAPAVGCGVVTACGPACRGRHNAVMQIPARRVAALLLALLAATGALKLATLGLARLDCWWLAPLVVALAWPLWAYRREQVMFVRRLLLLGATTETSRLRRWFWRGTVQQSVRVVTALLWAGAMLLMAAQLTVLQWVILAADAVLLAVLAPTLQGLLRHEVAPPFIGTVARGWPVLLGNALLLLVAFVAHDYAIGFADTRALSWNALVAQTMHAGQAGAACPAAGTLLGVAALADQLPRHAAMILFPDLDDARVRLLAWVAMLAVTGFGSYLFTRYLLGVQALVEARAQDAGPRPGRLFVATSLGALAVAGLWAAQGPSVGLAGLGHRAVLLAQTANPCDRSSGQARALQADVRQQLDEASRRAVDDAMRSLDSGLQRAFVAAEAGIDPYLDWYFSFIGSYTRMGALVIPDLAQQMRNRFSGLVFEDSGFEKEVASLGTAAEAAMLERFVAEVDAIGLGIAQQVAVRPCLIETVQPVALPGLERDAMRVALSAAVALPLSRAVAGLALRSGAAVMARAAASPTVRAAAGAAGAMSSKRGASVLLSAGTAAAVCAPGGPLALACAAVAGAVTWLGVDMAMIAIDEALFRKKMRSELVEALRGQRQQLHETLRSQLERAAADYRSQTEQRIDRIFVPARDG
jgi:hypothetical protein